MAPGAIEGTRDAAELHRGQQEGAAQRAAVGVVEPGLAVGGGPAVGGVPHPADQHLAREDAAEAGLAVLGDQPFRDHPEGVAGADVTAEVHLPGEDVGQIPGQPDPVFGHEEGVEGGVVQRLVERAGDGALEHHRLAGPADRLRHRVPAAVGPDQRHPLFRAAAEVHPRGDRVIAPALEAEHQAGAEAAGLEEATGRLRGQGEVIQPLPGKELGDRLAAAEGVEPLGEEHGHRRQRRDAGPAPGPIAGCRIRSRGDEDHRRQRECRQGLEPGQPVCPHVAP